MRLLVVTQKVDAKDPILGFFVHWLEEFSTTYSEIVVLAQEVGTNSLPSNVKVFSLGKERGTNRVTQVVKSWKLSWQLRHEYDAVLVHMTPIWIVLSGLLWNCLGKNCYLWYESKGRRWPLFAALFLVKKVFSATPLRLPFFRRKNTVTNHGVTTHLWHPSEERDECSIVTMGRISPQKRVELIIQAFASLPEKYRLFIIGGPFIGSDLSYYKKIEALIESLKLYDRVSIHFMSSTTARVYMRKAQLFLHASNGTLDKSLLQAMSSGTLVVSCSAINEFLPEQCQATPETFAEKIHQLISQPQTHDKLRKELRNLVLQNHSLSSLATRIEAEMEIRTRLYFRKRSLWFGICLLLTTCTQQVAASQKSSHEKLDIQHMEENFCSCL